MAIRYFFPALLAGGVTTILFWAMTSMIVVDALAPITPPIRFVPWVEVRPDRPPEPIRRRVVERPIAPQEPIPTDLPSPTPGGVTIPIVGDPLPADPLRGSRIGDLGRSADAEAVPMVRVPPRYPERALARGTEGRVLVEFTITASGGVRDARVIASEPSGIFDASALEAVRQWRYSPKIVNGVAVERPGVRISIPFRRELNESS